MAPHPLSNLSEGEILAAKELLVSLYPQKVLSFREIFLQEPAKAELVAFLDAEHAGRDISKTQRPSRLAKCQYDVIGSDKIPVYEEAVVDVEKKERVKHEVIGKEFHAALTLDEFDVLVRVCKASPEFQKAIAEFKLPEGFEVVVEPWPYGGLEDTEEVKRYFQGLVFAQDNNNGNPDSNFYAYPLPLIPVMDIHQEKIIRIDRLATGGKGDSLTGLTRSERVLDHCGPAEYVPELLPNGTRKDLKQIDITQPDGPSFSVKDESLVEWQKWRFRVSFNPREGAVIHDVHYDGRSVFHRLSISEMTVPYADARPVYVRKQAFDFGDGGAGNYANNLALGCDCLGVIKYFDGYTVNSDGSVQHQPNVICLHEQDAGIEWKHTNWRTGRAVVVRRRELVVQFVITLANYEYIFAYKFDLSGGIDIETRATGIVSCVNIDANKTSDYGNVVNPGVLAQNHQHIFAIRIDPAIEGHTNTVIQEESHTVPTNPTTNPKGNYYEVRQTRLETSTWADAAPEHNRVFKIVNENKRNKISGKPMGYKLVPPATQLLLADKTSLQAKRAAFAQHHVWVTKHRDDELYAAGRFTMQSRSEVGGVGDAVERRDNVADEDVVVWSVFGLTHNPRVEDWPVMPVEIHNVHLRPADFFERNPSLDVPSGKNCASRVVVVGNGHTNGTNGRTNGEGGGCH